MQDHGVVALEMDGNALADRFDALRTDDVAVTGIAAGNLFHCEDCGVVYIAAKKQSCATCETDVEQVRSTLSCQ